MKVKFIDLSLKDSPLEKKILGDIRMILRSGEFVSGKYVETFERAFAHFLGTRDVAAVSSGTAALHLALLALGLKPREEVILPSFTFAATAEAVIYCGGTPAFVDIGEDFTLDATKIEKAVTTRTVGILPVHLFGHMADMETILKIARRHKLWVLEDACQAHGASLNGKMAGTWGDLGVFSFYPTKNLGGIGEGGAIATKEKKTARFLRMLRNHGSSVKYQHETLGYNYRLNEIQAAALSRKLPFLEKWNDERRRLALIYSGIFKDMPLKIPYDKPLYEDVYHQYVIQTPLRNHLKHYLEQHGIETAIHYPRPFHQQPAFYGIGKPTGPLQVSERAAREVLSLPIYPGLSDKKVEFIAEKIQTFFTRESATKKVSFEYPA